MKEDNKRYVPDENRHDEAGTSGGDLTGGVVHKDSADMGGASTLDEKASTMSRRDKGTGLATKDGVTGSDYDGQLSQ